MKRRGKWRFLEVTVVGAVALFAVLWFARTAIIVDALKPPSTVRDLKSFQDWRGTKPTEYHVVNVNEHRYLIASVHEHMSKTIASGPACYVFDQSLQLTEYTIDIGDHELFQEKWNGHLIESNKVSAQDVAALLLGNP
ncbi:MAG: hypothetical protein K2W85_12265 [Phycisphaerales bacterium]|nr:hypothetical protein [Phycisphaerales bacterium]